MRVLVMAGHTLRGKGTGASKYLNESKETKYRCYIYIFR